MSGGGEALDFDLGLNVRAFEWIGLGAAYKAVHLVEGADDVGSFGLVPRKPLGSG